MAVLSQSHAFVICLSLPDSRGSLGICIFVSGPPFPPLPRQANAITRERFSPSPEAENGEERGRATTESDGVNN